MFEQGKSTGKAMFFAEKYKPSMQVDILPPTPVSCVQRLELVLTVLGKFESFQFHLQKGRRNVDPEYVQNQGLHGSLARNIRQA